MSFPIIKYGAPGEQFNTYVAEAVRGLASAGRFLLSQKLELADGRLFRFGLAGGTELAANKLAQGIASVGDQDTLAVQAAVAVGDTTIPVTEVTTFTAEGDLIGGHAIVESAAALGHLYKIASNTGASSGATTETLALVDGETVQAALTTSHKVTLVHSTWFKTIVTPNATLTGPCAGVNQVLIATTDYGWFQTHGVASCLLVGAGLVGNQLIPAATAGSIGVQVSQTTNVTIPVGYVVEVAPTTDFGMVFLIVE